MPSKRPSKKTSKITGSSKAVKRPSAKSGAKLDLYAKHKSEYVASANRPSIVRVGPAKYLSITGSGAPGSEPFTRAIGAMYNVAYTIKMARKSAGQDFRMMALEGLWVVDSPSGKWSDPNNKWTWELMIRVPTFINEKELKSTIDQLLAKGKDPEVGRVKLAEYTEGECVQMLHVGPYSTEEETVGKMREFAAMAGRQFSGKHHEIYLSDPRRVAPEKLKTILRIPIS